METRIAFDVLQDVGHVQVCIAGYGVEISLRPPRVSVRSPHQPFIEEVQVQAGGRFRYTDPYVIITGRDDMLRHEVVVELEEKLALYKQNQVLLLLAT